MATDSSIMAARNFTLFQPLGSFVLNDLDDYNSFKKNIAGQVQGEIALFQEDWPADVAALSFAVAFELSDEVLIRLASGKIVRLFKHSGELAAYPEMVDSSLAQELEKLVSNSVFISTISEPQPVLNIDLSELWNQAKQNNSVQRALDFSKIFSAALRPAEIINLIGEIPILPLFCAIILSRPCGRRIYFKTGTAGDQLKLF